MDELVVKEKEIVVPGEVLAKGMEYLPANGTYRDGELIRAMQVGTVNLSGRLIKLIPLSGQYIPQVNDIIIGRITEVGIGGWLLDIEFSNLAGLSSRDTDRFIERDADLANYYNFGDYVVAKVTKVTKSKLINLSTRDKGLRRLDSGIIFKVAPVKVPRIIGKGGSMISMVKEKTDTRITVGQNGVIWLSGTDPIKEKLAIDTIKYIEENAHLEGLTELVSKMLESKTGKEKREVKEEKKEEKESKGVLEELSWKPLEKPSGKNEKPRKEMTEETSERKPSSGKKK